MFSKIKGLFFKPKTTWGSLDDVGKEQILADLHQRVEALEEVYSILKKHLAEVTELCDKCNGKGCPKCNHTGYVKLKQLISWDL